VPVRAVLFDLDGTLVDSERAYAQAMTIALRDQLGIEVGQGERDYVVGRSWTAIHAHLCEVHPQITWSRDELIAATVRAFAGGSAGALTVLPGARAAVERFRALPLGLVTGSSRVEARHALAALGLSDAFAAVFACEDCARSKPAPDGYLAAAAALGLAPAECLVVEDSHAGIAAGREAGALVIAVRAGNYAGHDQSGAHRVVDTLDHITWELLGELERGRS
jgi:beta-phosphoglucomutase-like phosphatase (HAD superfamily)